MTIEDQDEFEREFWELIRGPAYEPAELDPALAVFLGTDSSGPTLHHPCYCGPYKTSNNAHYNCHLESFKEKVSAAKGSRNWHDYLHAHEKCFWTAALNEIEALATPEEWAAAVREAWILSDEIWINDRDWRLILGRAQRVPSWMTQNEKDRLEVLPESFPVYRGCRADQANGLSWSLESDAAAHFARKVKGHRGVVATGTARKADVIALLHGDEDEVIVLPESVLMDDPKGFERPC